jgi:hypothetical protein
VIEIAQYGTALISSGLCYYLARYKMRPKITLLQMVLIGGALILLTYVDIGQAQNYANEIVIVTMEGILFGAFLGLVAGRVMRREE